MAKHAPRDLIPEIPVRPKMSWVKNLNSTDRATRDQRRETEIENDRAATFAKLRRLSAFDSVPDEAINFIALDMAVLSSDSFENGIQVGKDWRSEQDALELEQAHRFAVHATSAGTEGLG